MTIKNTEHMINESLNSIGFFNNVV